MKTALNTDSNVVQLFGSFDWPWAALANMMTMEVSISLYTNESGHRANLQRLFLCPVQPLALRMDRQNPYAFSLLAECLIRSSWSCV